MGKIALLSRQSEKDEQNRHLTVERAMPVDYMNDFSVLGILVDRLPEATRLLEEHRFQIVVRKHCTEIVTSGIQQLRDLFDTLDNGGIEFGVADLAESIYQG